MSETTATARAALLARARARTPGAGGPPADRPVRRPADAPPAPASFVQEQLWFVHHLAPDVPMHNITFDVEVDGDLDAAAFERAWAALLDRQPVLRTRLRLTAAGLLQDQGAAAAPIEHGVAAGSADAARIMRELARTRFDLDAGPLVRARLLRLGSGGHRFGFAAHHAVIDGWSVGVLLDELAACYAAARSGDAPAPAPADGITFADVAAWQRERICGDRLARLTTSWRERLAGAVPTGFRPDRPRPAGQTHDGGMVRFTVPRPVAERLTELVTATSRTPFMALLAAFAVLLAAESGHRDVVIGVPVAGRGRPELERVIGPVSDTLPVRFPVGGAVTYRELLGVVADATLDLAALHDLPFSRIVEALGRPRDISRNPIVETLFNIGNLPQGADGVRLAGGVVLRPVPVPNDTVRLDLEMTMEPGPDELNGRLEYNRRLFTRATAERLAERFLGLLDTLTARPDEPVEALLAPRPASRLAAKVESWF